MRLISEIIARAERLFGFEDHIEISLEANPGAVDAKRFSAYLQAGVNRLSMGVQSLNDRELLWLERIHDSKQALKAFEAARKAGFDNINLDLIYGLPDQSLDQWLQSLERAIELGPEHLSCYQLTVEPHTKLAAKHAKKPYPLPDDELALRFFHETRQQLQSAGYDAYEISNFAQPALKCRHNDGYWKYHDYIGIGAGAAGKWDNRGHENTGGITRYSNIRSPERYIKSAIEHGCAIHSRESLNCNQAAAEACWLALRRSDGINRNAFLHRFGFDVWEHFQPQLQAWKDNHKLLIHGGSVQLSASGISIADTISASVL